MTSELNINILLCTVSTLCLSILKLESIVLDKQNVWERLYFMLFLISFFKTAFLLSNIINLDYNSLII